KPGKPAKSVKPADKEKTGPQPVPVAVADVNETNLEQERMKAAERIKAAEKEKRRAMVRKMLREIQQNPVGGLFE
ncbi:MAG: hypothetical protein NUV51_01365, partial [Sulfuricaulis sp.]|nr:hypothetical protein [Sulfuricaulis sp.]